MAYANQAPAPEAEGPTPHTPNQDQPSVYQLMAQVMRDVKNVGKNGVNKSQNYSFRGVDDAIGALAQPLRDHGVFMTPEVLDFHTEVRGKMNAVRMRVAFHFYGPAGDKVTSVTLGEASDVADKASNKAMSAALKYALIHTFMIPVDAGSLDDGDRDHPVGRRSTADAFVERLRKPHVWNNPTALAALHSEAKAEGQLDAEVEGPNGPVSLGELIVSRGTQLKAEAAEREERREADSGRAAAQVATEHAVPETDQAAAGIAAPSLAEFKEKVTRSWDHLDAMRQNLLEAEKTGLFDQVIPAGPDNTPTRLGELLNNRVAELEAKQSERNAA